MICNYMYSDLHRSVELIWVSNCTVKTEWSLQEDKLVSVRQYLMTNVNCRVNTVDVCFISVDLNGFKI